MKRYGLTWNDSTDVAQVEAAMYRAGGYKEFNGKKYGEGKLHHFKSLISALCPWFSWHIYSNMLADAWVNYNLIGVAGPASTGKTFSIAMFAYAEFFCYPRGTSIMMSSITLEGLRLRVWGAITEIIGKVKERRPNAPGYIVASERRIYPTEPSEQELRDPRDAVMGIACKVGDTFVGIGCFPSGTLVDTPGGAIPIELIQIGDKVLNASGIGIVTATQTRTADRLVAVILEDGTRIECTANHPFLTRLGWKKAVDITPNDSVCLTNEAMRILWSGFQQQHKREEILQLHVQGGGAVVEEKTLASLCCMQDDHSGLRSRAGEVLLADMPGQGPHDILQGVQETICTEGWEERILQQILFREMDYVGLGSCCTNSIETGLEGDRAKGECSNHVESRGAQASCGVGPCESWPSSVYARSEKLDKAKEERRNRLRRAWEWWDSTGIGTGFLKVVSRSKTPVYDSDKTFSQGRIPTLVSGGLLISRKDACCGNRRGLPCEANQERERCQERQSTNWLRVVRVESSGEDCFGRSTTCSSGCVVHNLSVSGHPSYSVSGVLVHNSYVGIKNGNVIGAFDEASLMPGGFWDAIANLKKNPRTKFVAMGNPKGLDDALSKICEPEQGWDALPYSNRSRTWRTRGGGIAVQLSGLDTPNGTDVNGVKCEGLNRYPYLITPEQIEDDRKWYGEDSWQYQMMDLGVFPKGASTRRIITRDICDKGNAFGEPLWDGITPTQDYIGIDAAYSGVGGDRSPLIHIRTGKDINGTPILAIVNGPVLIPVDINIKDEDGNTVPAEQQIAQYAMDYCKRHNIPSSHVGYDSTGRGTLVHAFANLWTVDTCPVEFGGLPPEGRKSMEHETITEREKYGKMVTALWFAVRNLIVQKQLRKLPMSVFEEGTLREYIVTKSGKEDVEIKEMTKKRLGRSPDLFDSLVAAVEVARRNGFHVGMINKNKIATTVKWLEKRRDEWRSVRKSEVLIEA